MVASSFSTRFRRWTMPALLIALTLAAAFGPMATEATGQESSIEAERDGPPSDWDTPSQPGGPVDRSSAPTWQLPFENGQQWQAGGAHGSSMHALDFGPGGSPNGRVVTMAAGTVVRIVCAGGDFLAVDHANGWQTRYYHLTNYQFQLVGQTVPAGTYLGEAGQTLPCGGFSSFNHVHVSFHRNGVAQPIDGFRIGNYTAHEDPLGRPYHGSWRNLSGQTVIDANGLARCCLTSTTTAEPAATCAGRLVTINMNTNGGLGLGTAGNDVILGTAGPDVIAAGAGDDLVCSGDGDDTIWGQAGADTVFGEGGDDTIRGGSGDDELRGGNGADDLAGGTGNDVVDGDAGDDPRVRGGTGDDTVRGGAGNDALVAGNGGSDRVFGGGGNDVLTGGPRPDLLYGGDGRDELKGNGGGDELFGESGNDELLGGGQQDVLNGGGGTDTCKGGTTDPASTEADTATSCESITQVP